METTPQMFLLGNQPMPVRFAGRESFTLANAKAYSYLLIASDTSDGVQELFLYQKADNKIRLLSRKKVPFQFHQGLAQKLTGVIFQQVWYCRQNTDVSLESFLRDFGKLFPQSELSMKLLKELAVICNQSQISYNALYKIASQLLEKCGWNYLVYKKYLMQKMKYHPMRTLLKSVFLDWLCFCQIAAEMLEETKEWKTDDYPMLYFACYGSSYLTALMSYISKTESDKETELPDTIVPEKDTDIFQFTEKLFHATQQNLKSFAMRFSSVSYESKLVHAYTKAKKAEALQAGNSVYPLYAETALCLPSDASIHVGKWQGAKRAVSNVDGAEQYLMPAPLSEEFSALVASGKASILEQKWTKQSDGWVFHMEYTYHDRNESNPYRPVDKYYTQEQIVKIDKFPEILVTQKKGQQELSILAQQNACSIEMSEAVSDGVSLKLPVPEKMPYDYMLYFKLFDGNQKYLGQFTCNLTPKKKEG